VSSVAGTLVEPLSAEQIAALPTYDWDVAEIGHAAPPFTYGVTEAAIASYCLAVRNENPLYVDPKAAAGGPFGGIVAPPGFVFMCSPLRRNEVMHAQGYASRRRRPSTRPRTPRPSSSHGARSAPATRLRRS
jgi:hypothetical protein